MKKFQFFVMAHGRHLRAESEAFSHEKLQTFFPVRSTEQIFRRLENYCFRERPQTHITLLLNDRWLHYRRYGGKRDISANLIFLSVFLRTEM
jgi:hypothetical protein